MTRIFIIVDVVGKVKDDAFEDESVAQGFCDKRNAALRRKYPEIRGDYLSVATCKLNTKHD